MALRILLPLLLLLAACPAPPPSQTRPPDPVQTPPATNDPGSPQDVDPTPPSTPPPNESKKADGAACLDGNECASGTCEGEGCSADQPGTCKPRARGCTRDLRTYCGCDGKTFQASGSCPLRRFKARATCEAS